MSELYSRLLLIKKIHQGKIKPKKKRVSSHTKPRFRGNESKYPCRQKDHRKSVHARFRQEHKSHKLCKSCIKPSVTITYSYNDRVIHQRAASLCPRHWGDLKMREEFRKVLDAIPVSA